MSSYPEQVKMKSLSELAKRKIHETTFEILDSKNRPALLQWHKGLKDLPKNLKQDLQNEAEKLELPTSKNILPQDDGPILNYIKKMNDFIQFTEDNIRRKFQ